MQRGTPAPAGPTFIPFPMLSPRQHAHAPHTPSGLNPQAAAEKRVQVDSGASTSSATSTSMRPSSSKRGRQSNTPASVASIEELESASAATVAGHLRSQSTAKQYEGYIKRGMEFLAASHVVTQEGAMGFTEQDWRLAFTHLSHATPRALRLFMASKCEATEENPSPLRYSTAEGIRSAWKQYFERQLNCQGAGVWRSIPDGLGGMRWEGNPVFEHHFDSYMKSLKKRHGRSADITNRALPMTYTDLGKCLAWLSKQVSNVQTKAFQVGSENLAKQDKYTEASCRFMRAYLTLTWHLMARTDEIKKLCMSNLVLNVPFKTTDVEDPSFLSKTYDTVTLTFRKTNQADPTKSNVYQLHDPDPLEPMLEPRRWLRDWIAYVQQSYPHGLCAKHQMFPALTSDDSVKISTEWRPGDFDKLLAATVKGAGLQGTVEIDGSRPSGLQVGQRHSRGKYTAHCCRRGAAQHRFIYTRADRKWDLAPLKWWGGWAASESVDTLIKYILEDSIREDNYYGDSTNPYKKVHIPERDRELSAATVNDVESLEGRLALRLQESAAAHSAKLQQRIGGLESQVQRMTSSHKSEIERLSNQLQQLTDLIVNRNAATYPPPTPSVSSLLAPFLQTSNHITASALAASPVATSAATSQIQAAPRIPLAPTAQDCAGLPVALKDWPSSWKRGQPLYGQRATVYRGYELAKRDWAVFESQYGVKVGEAVVAIRKDLLARGEIRRRVSKKAAPAAPAPALSTAVAVQSAVAASDSSAQQALASLAT